MFNNSTNIFIDTLASLQKLDDLERLLNPNSAYFQSYRNSFNEVNLNYTEEEPNKRYTNSAAKNVDHSEYYEPRFAIRNLPSLECLPSIVLMNRVDKPAPIETKESESTNILNRSEHSDKNKPRNRLKHGFTKLDTLDSRSPELKTQFSFQKTENTKTTKGLKNNSTIVPTSKCTCANSRCLKLYCACFANGEVCGPQCQCKSCFNNDANDEIRQKMIEETLQKNPNAFQSKYKRHVQKNEVLHVRGCHCSKTGCIKEYCECFKIGIGCSRLCKCINCQNKKIDLQTDEVKEYYVKTIRKRRKTKFYEQQFGNNSKKAHLSTNSEMETLP